MRREVNYDEVFDAQHHFRIILDSMSRPGKINTMPVSDIVAPERINSASVLVAFALLNGDVTFYVADENIEITEYLALNTVAKPVAASKADFIFMNGLHNDELISEAKTGTLPYPEDGATFIIDVETISEEVLSGAVRLKLKGPGVDKEKSISITGLNPEILNAVKEQNFEFPLGVDLILTDKSSRILCIPRSNKFLIETGETELAEITELN